MKKTIIFCVLLLLVFSCKKQRLVKDKTVLVGEWNWVYSQTKNDTIYPNSIVENCKLEFLEKGKFKVFKNGKLVSENKTNFLQFETVQDTFYFSIKLKESITSYDAFNTTPTYYILSGKGYNNILQIYQYPYLNESIVSENFNKGNFFKKKE
jgi:hypothetical protein